MKQFCTMVALAGLMLSAPACQALAQEAPAQSPVPASADKPLPKWVITHTMGMMPATNWYGLNGLFPETRYARSRPATHFSRAFGGQYRMLPLGALDTFVKQDGTYDLNHTFVLPGGDLEEARNPHYLRDKYRWDLEWAERMGVDGFGVLLSRNPVSKKYAVGWFQAMEQILREKPDTNLRITIMFSGHELPNEKEPWRYGWLKELCQEYKDSPAWLRHEGRVVFMGYRSMATWDSAEGIKVSQAKASVAEHQAFLKSLGMGDPLFIYDGTEYLASDFKKHIPRQDPALLAPIAEEVCKAFDGYMVWGGVIPDATYRRNYPSIAKAVNDSGKAWGMPIINIHSGIGQFYISRPGVERLIETWDFAHQTGAQLAQIVTWNDWNEATGYAPSVSFNYAFTSLNQKFTHRFKHGRFPEAVDDTVYLFYRKYHPDADPYLYPRATVERDRNTWGQTDDVLHVIVFAKEAGTLKVTGTPEGEAALELQAGFNQFKLKTAVGEEIAARIYRGGALEHELISPERVTDRPYREDLVPWGWSSDCRGLYDEAFGSNFRPISYYSQRYDDGIPDWFRLHYFGTTELPAGGLPHEDPDGDGVDNLREYQLGEDPTRPNPVYPVGYVWDEIPKAFAAVNPKEQNHSQRVNLNPYPDRHGKLVHTFLYKKGGKLDGAYLHMNKWNNKGPMLGWSLRNWSKFGYRLSEDQGIAMNLLSRYAGIYRFWSPVQGTLRYTCVMQGDPDHPVNLYIKKDSEELFAGVCEPGEQLTAEVSFQTQRRDRIDFIAKPVGRASAKVTLHPKIEVLEAKQNTRKDN